jgi:hypothetical protein
MLLPTQIEDFIRECLVDNRMTAMSLQAGKVIAPAEVIYLSSEVQALHLTVALQCRGLESIKQYRSLWSAAHEFFDAACRIWADAPQDGELLASHRTLLEHLRAMARDQVEFYTIDQSDRAAYQIRKIDVKDHAGGL